MKDKIAKLLAQAGSAKEIGNHAEAAAFAEKVQALLIQYNLSMDDINTDSGDDRMHDTYSFHSGIRRTKWVDGLAHVLSDHFLVETIMIDDTTKTILVGKNSSIQTFLVVFKALYNYINSNAKKQSLKGKRAYNSYKLGFVLGIKEQLDSKVQIQYDSKSCRALTVVENEKEANDKYIDSKFETHKTKNTNIEIDVNAYEIGASDGRKAPIHGQPSLTSQS